MYAHCLFCNAGLGRNEALEAFPVGRRLAYDADKGRLWVVCPACNRWNLTPLEERWEAIEQAERLFRGTRLRASTDNVGLARVADGVDLVRIGAPLRPELAAWRYAATFARRHRRAIGVRSLVYAGGLAALGIGAWVVVSADMALPLLFGSLLAGVSRNPNNESESNLRAGNFVVRVPISGVPVSISRAAVDATRVGFTSEYGFHLTLPYAGTTRLFRGSDGTRAAASLLTYTNAAGATRESVSNAVEALVAAGSAQNYLASVGRKQITLRRGRGDPAGAAEIEGTIPLVKLADRSRLALEMAVHEEQERRAMDGELAALEQAWRDAEEIAAIADSLALPRGVTTAWERLRSR